ncbi:hypothetical protein BaRGS_00039068 [Batillaria attramentaria]|uniref:Uncharacterized protein n=1 Tax=Batillaria attramentaria TaxID=370345 RepID=A0ABD0J507_9CAEN
MAPRPPLSPPHSLHQKDDYGAKARLENGEARLTICGLLDTDSDEYCSLGLIPPSKGPLPTRGGDSRRWRRVESYSSWHQGTLSSVALHDMEGDMRNDNRVLLV